MAPPKTSKKASNPQKKEKLFHPQSRKADQLVRVQHRKQKLEGLAKARHQKQREQVDIFNFFYKCLPSEDVPNLELSDLHSIIRDIWLVRYDDELEQERKARRSGRPKSMREIKFEELKLRESEEYRTGFEVLDLTDPDNVKLFRQWDQKDAAYIKQLRFIRVSSENPDTSTIARPGKHSSLSKAVQRVSQDISMSLDEDEDEAPLLIEASAGFSSTIMGMDDIPV